MSLVLHLQINYKGCLLMRDLKDIVGENAFKDINKLGETKIQIVRQQYLQKMCYYKKPLELRQNCKVELKKMPRKQRKRTLNWF